MKLSSIRIDAVRADAGDWFGDLPDMGDLRLKVRRIDNPDARKLRDRLVDAVPRAQKVGGKLDAAVAEAIQAQVLAETVLLGWENMVGEDDKPIAFSPPLARDLLANPDLAIFRDAVVIAAGRLVEHVAA